MTSEPLAVSARKPFVRKSDWDIWARSHVFEWRHKPQGTQGDLFRYTPMPKQKPEPEVVAEPIEWNMEANVGPCDDWSAALAAQAEAKANQQQPAPVAPPALRWRTSPLRVAGFVACMAAFMAAAAIDTKERTPEVRKGDRLAVTERERAFEAIKADLARRLRDASSARHYEQLRNRPFR